MNTKLLIIKGETDMTTKYELKELIDSMAEAVESAGSAMGLDGSAGNAAKFELAMFMMYLSASDGEIQWSEASTISDLCDLNLTPQSLSNFIRENNIYSTEFENKVPVTLQIMVTMENKLLEIKSADEIADVSSLVINTYKTVAEFLMNADGDEDDNEKKDCQIYIDMLENYVSNNATRRKASVSGFVKNSGGVSAPTKSGVSAPIKKG